MDNRELLQEITQLVSSSAKETREHVDTSVRASAKETREYVDTSVRASAKETREYVDTSVRASAKETREYVDATARETRDHFDAVVESLEHPMRMIADGQMMLVQRVDRLQQELRSEMAAQADRQITVMRGLDEKLAMDLRAEIRNELAEVRRVGRIEAVVGELAARVERIEQKMV
jgi:hypothetical protein